jgi:uncharacterized sporulation protein YeaH/YhbH (DUF444 family)
VLSHIQKKTHLDPKERHRLENEALARRHAREKRTIQRRRRTLARLETRETHSLENAVRREQRLQEAAQAAVRFQSRDWREGDLQQEFDAAAGVDRKVQEAGDEGLAPDWRDGDLQQRFDTAADFHRDYEDSGDGDDGPAQDSDESSDDDDKGPGSRPRRRKAYGYR